MVYVPSAVHFVMVPWPQKLEVLHAAQHSRSLLLETAKDHSSRYSLWDTAAVLAGPAVVALVVDVGGRLSLEETRSPFHSIEMDSTSFASLSWFIRQGTS